MPAFLVAAVRLATMPDILDPDLALFLIDLVEHSVIPVRARKTPGRLITVRFSARSAAPVPPGLHRG